MKTRRKFISDCTLSLAALALIPSAAVTASVTEKTSAICLNHAALSQEVNTVFTIRLAGGQMVDLTLLKAPLAPPRRTMGAKPPLDLNHEKFSLIFSGPKEVALDSAIHQLEHQKLGRLEIHLGQIGTPDADRLRYEAVFNQPASTMNRPNI